MSARSWEFGADLKASSLGPDGRLTLTFEVDLADKYDAMPISDIRGKKFRVKVETASTRVIAGPDDIEAHKKRVQARRADRKSCP